MSVLYYYFFMSFFIHLSRQWVKTFVLESLASARDSFTKYSLLVGLIPAYGRTPLELLGKNRYSMFLHKNELLW